MLTHTYAHTHTVTLTHGHSHPNGHSHTHGHLHTHGHSHMHRDKVACLHITNNCLNKCEIITILPLSTLFFDFLNPTSPSLIRQLHRCASGLLNRTLSTLHL